MRDTSIQWTEKSWNPVRGCSRVSEGCRNCYAERQAARFCADDHSAFHGFVQIANGHPQWTGKVELIGDRLLDPMRRRKPSMIFVNSMSDLFHEALPDEAIAEVFRAMYKADWHTYQILTKRADRLALLMPRLVATFGIMPQVWLGVSVENQATADARIPLLVMAPAALRFISYEPALGPVDFTRFRLDQLHLIIAGGESGAAARPPDPAWMRSARDQCAKAGLHFFFKQWGEWLPAMCEGAVVDGNPAVINRSDAPVRVGKTRAGAFLDGLEHRGMPPVREFAMEGG